jgi:hypothetical protein
LSEGKCDLLAFNLFLDDLSEHARRAAKLLPAANGGFPYARNVTE